MATRLDEQRASFAALGDEVAKAVHGYRSVTDRLVIALLAEGHVLLEGVPGLAKTTLAKSFAVASGLDFRRVQFTQDLLPADVVGHSIFDPTGRRFDVRKGPVFANVLLADEINRAPSKTQSALLEAMEERQVTIDGDTLPLPRPFLVVATMNPVDAEGVYRLPEAQLDRFLFRVRMGYLAPEDELAMLRERLSPERPVGRASSPTVLEAAVAARRRVHVSEAILAYVHALGRATRADARVRLGASPRAMLALVRAAQGAALLDGRDYAIPEDVRALAGDVLDHRIVLDVAAEVEGARVEEVVRDAVASVSAPKGLGG